MQCSIRGLKCTNEATNIMDYRVHRNESAYELEYEGEKIYRVSVSSCPSCGVELEKRLPPFCRDSLIINPILE
jgi:hypothetical protein